MGKVDDDPECFEFAVWGDMKKSVVCLMGYPALVALLDGARIIETNASLFAASAPGEGAWLESSQAVSARCSHASPPNMLRSARRDSLQH